MSGEQSNTKSKRGFASMSPEKRREIAAQGGKAAHEKGVSPSFTPETARLAGLKGGATTGKDREHMSDIGRKGGLAPRNKQR